MSSSLTPGTWGSWNPPRHRDVALRVGAVGLDQGWIPQIGSLGCPMQGQCRDEGSWGWVSPPGVGVASLTSPVLLCSGQKYMTAVVKVFGPLTRNYYIRAILHAA